MKKVLLILLPLLPLLFLGFCPNTLMPTLVVYGSPAADERGNDINYIEVWQYDGETWILRANFSSSGESADINDNQQVRFVVGIRFNSSLASNENEAINYTRVFMNITYNGNYVWQNIELNNTSCVLNGNYYILREEGNWTSNLPQQGVTYHCNVSYKSYWR
ncbi:MAG: hypothetical protein QXI91_06525 [Candidatus Bathyarchaeia archaeon]